MAAVEEWVGDKDPDLQFWADGTGTPLVQVHHSRGQLQMYIEKEEIDLTQKSVRLFFIDLPSYHYKIQVKFDVGNHPPNFGWVMAFFRLIFCCSFPLNNFWRGALMSFKLFRTLYQLKMQVKFNIGNHLPNFGWVMALFQLNFCWCVDIGFWSITFAGMHWFYWKFTEGYSQTCVKQAPVGKPKIVCLKQVLA